MSSTSPPVATLSAVEVMQDLEAGRSLPLRPRDRLVGLQVLPRPTLGGGRFLRSYLSARLLGRIHPRLARRALMRLWFTPWVHPSALRAVHDLTDDLVPWSLPAGGRMLRGYAGGSGPTVVLVHGWAARAADWRHMAHDLIVDGWRIVVPDLPAHGMTAGSRTDLFELGRALATVLDHERPVAVVAHSMGFPTTMLAFEETASTPVTLVAIAPGRKIAHALEGFGAKAGLRPALRDELRRGLVDRFGPDVWDSLDVDRVIPGLEVPGLVVHDADDEDVSRSDARHIADHWPGARFVGTEGLGHRRILRDPSARKVVMEALAEARASSLAHLVGEVSTDPRR